MSWTDDRVATLTKLWNDGLCASIIATRIGEVTRNLFSTACSPRPAPSEDE